VRKLAAYHIDETPVRVKLDAMENPFSLPDAVRREIASVVRNTKINLYPDPSAKKLKQAIASMWRMKPGQMILGNGSDELIQAVILAFGGPVLVPAPTFAMYDITSRALAQEVITVPLNADFDLDADLMLKKAKAGNANVIFLASPNNPTGNRFSDKAIQKILDYADAAVVIDEAYYSFSGKTFLPLLKTHPNLIILRTLSKIGFAGLRVGVMTAAPAVVHEINKIRLPYNINSLSQAVAATALKHRDIIERQISLLISEREKLYNALTHIRKSRRIIRNQFHYVQDRYGRDGHSRETQEGRHPAEGSEQARAAEELPARYHRDARGEQGIPGRTSICFSRELTRIEACFFFEV